MARHRAAALLEPPPARALQELPARAVTFLRIAGGQAPIRARLVAAGYGLEEHEEGRRLLLATCPFCTGGGDPGEDLRARAAAAEIERWVPAQWPRLRAAVEHRHPESVAVIDELAAAPGARALLLVAALLARLDALEEEPRARALLATLARRGLDRAERARLGALVRAAQGLTAADAAAELAASSTGGGPAPAPDAGDDVAALRALHAWYRDWATTARAVIERRDWLIRLGVVDRRRAAVPAGGEPA